MAGQDFVQQDLVQAAFLCNRTGDVCIAFDDPAFVQSDAILIDVEKGNIHAILHEADRLLGHVSPIMLKAFRSRDTALLTAVRPDGSIFEMTAPVSTMKQ